MSKKSKVESANFIIETNCDCGETDGIQNMVGCAALKSFKNNRTAYEKNFRLQDKNHAPFKLNGQSCTAFGLLKAPELQRLSVTIEVARKGEVSSLCPMCKKETENTAHFILQCANLQEVIKPFMDKKISLLVQFIT
jgi:hypothetical protein